LFSLRRPFYALVFKNHRGLLNSQRCFLSDAVLIRKKNKVFEYKLSRFKYVELVRVPKLVSFFFREAKNHAYVFLVRRGLRRMFSLPFILYFGKLEEAEKVLRSVSDSTMLPSKHR
jgi:hypothetical protein